MAGALRRPLALCLAAGIALAALPVASTAQTITGAEYADPTTRYDHGVLGDAIEWGALVMDLSDGTRRKVTLRETRVFEDTAPRLADLDGDGAPEVLAVESDIATGARLSVYGPDGLIAATPHIGQTHRWLAPVGAADLDGDGRVEIAYVDRPHLARILRIWRLEHGQMVELATLDGVTNHRIGDATIAGGIASCEDGARMILFTPDWQRVVAARFDGATITASDAGPNAGPSATHSALACR